MVRLRRGEQTVIVNVGLTPIAADHIAEIIDDDRTEEEVTPLA